MVGFDDNSCWTAVKNDMCDLPAVMIDNEQVVIAWPRVDDGDRNRIRYLLINTIQFIIEQYTVIYNTFNIQN